MKVEIAMFDGFLTLMEFIDSVTIGILYCGVSRKYGVSTAIEVAQSATNNHQKIKTQQFAPTHSHWHDQFKTRPPSDVCNYMLQEA